MAYYLVHKHNKSLSEGKIHKMQQILKLVSFCETNGFPLVNLNFGFIIK